MISRLDFAHWNRKVDEYEARIKEIERKIMYRRIEVLGPRDASPLKKLTCEEHDRLECDPTIIMLNNELVRDPTIIMLNNELVRYRNDLDYLRATGDIPEYRK